MSGAVRLSYHRWQCLLPKFFQPGRNLVSDEILNSFKMRILLRQSRLHSQPLLNHVIGFDTCEDETKETPTIGFDGN